MAGSAQLSRFAITQASDELSERLLFHCSSGVARAFAQKPVKIGKERLRLNIIAIDHAIIRSIKRVDFEFFTRQILDILPDRSTKLATKLPAFTKSLRAWVLKGRKGKNLFELEQLQRACSRTVIRTDNVRPIELEQLQRASSYFFWCLQKAYGRGF